MTDRVVAGPIGSAAGGGAGLPWVWAFSDLVQLALDATEDNAVVVFLVDERIPPAARAGYASLILAYTRDDEPVAVLRDGGAVLLVRHGGAEAARRAGARILDMLAPLGLRQTLRVGVTAVTGDVQDAIRRAQEIAREAGPGRVTVEEM